MSPLITVAVIIVSIVVTALLTALLYRVSEQSKADDSGGDR